MRWKVISLGTTSARSGKMDDKMIDLIESIDEFWKQNTGKWEENQLAFAKFVISKGFMYTKLTANEKLEKFARQKTSYLVQLGFVDDNRRKTDLGNYLAKSEVKDTVISFLNNKQISFLIGTLNYEQEDSGFIFRKLINYLVENNIKKLSKDFIFKFLTLNYLTDTELYTYVSSFGIVNDLQTFSKIIHNQKGEKYNKKYFDLYNFIRTNKTDPKLVFKKIDGTMSSLSNKCFKTIFFGNTNLKNVNKFLIDIKTDSDILVLMLKSKLLSLNEEYFDLNKRTLIATGVFSFDDENYLYISDIFLELVKKLDLNKNDFIKTSADIFIKDINSFAISSENNDVQLLLDQKRSRDFEKYLNEELSFLQVLEFIKDMSEGNYSLISKFFKDSGKDNATYAEFLISVAFHYLTERKNNFILSWNGTLNNDNTPKRHASGGIPDAQFYINNKIIIVETTIQTSQQQTTNEVAPVSKHYNEIKSKEKMGVLFAKNIFKETQRLFEMHRKSGELIYTMNFFEFYEILSLKNISYRKWEEMVIDV